mmetsp:Transcript_102409/g.293814  ORF Transcript_102409/g.293814 Transcript_102409/m.293814 type:complete len:85 (-) Transcript_102409:347-601(-)
MLATLGPKQSLWCSKVSGRYLYPGEATDIRGLISWCCSSVLGGTRGTWLASDVWIALGSLDSYRVVEMILLQIAHFQATSDLNL